MYKTIIVAFLFAISLASCDYENQSKENNSATLHEVKTIYAKRFAILKSSDFTVLQLKGADNKISAEFVLYKTNKPIYHPKAYYIKTPVKRIVSLSSIYTTMLFALGNKDEIIAIDNIDYYTNKILAQKVAQGNVKEVSKSQQLNIEKIVSLSPDLVINFGMGNQLSESELKLQKFSIPCVTSLDHLEELPLARAEWIKFFGCLTNTEDKADSIFNIIEKKYLQLRALTKNTGNKPIVMTEIKYGDTWYVPSGNSYVANLIKDAGGIYFYQDDKQTGSTPLTFEKVYELAKECDVWINQYSVNSKKELLSYDERYKLFKAYQTDRLFNNNKTQNKLGYSNFWEEGILRPDMILEDLIKILYPDTNQNPNFNFYKKLQ
jgi:iron complex transport system substrate-binding protein